MNSHAVLAEGMAAAEVGRATRPPARRPVERRRAPDLPFAIDADERNLRALLAVMAVVSLFLAVAVTIVFINQGFFWFGVAALGLSAVGVAMLVVRRMLTRSTLATGARVVSWSLLMLVLVMLIGGNRAPTLAMTALLAVLVAVPYVDGRELRRLAVAAFALTALIGLGYGLSAPPSSHSAVASVPASTR